ncbi:MAG TPA: CBS domain-containing protein [Planctomycetota bacterium]|nr:CBS domain-containing protein [Planctomycetota bacterium]
MSARARDVMCRPVRKVMESTRVRDAAQFLRRWKISGVPVVDAHGRPVGVFSLMDLAAHVHDRMIDLPAIDPGEERALKSGETLPLDAGFHFEAIDDARVSELMTPEIVCVDPDAPLEAAVRAMEQRSIHRVFVRRRDGPLEGVITTMDILRWVGRKLRSDGRRRKTKGVA